ncbi:MAG: hypothetical protein QW407_03305 [Thermofilaceae archaeon]
MVDVMVDTVEFTPEVARFVRRAIREEVKALVGYAESIGRKLERKGIVVSVMVDEVPGQQGVFITINLVVQRVTKELVERVRRATREVKDLTESGGVEGEEDVG